MRKFFLFIFVASFLLSCKKDSNNNTQITPVVTNVFNVILDSSYNINVTDFTLKGTLQVTSSTQAIEYGFIFSSYPDPSIYQGKVIGIGSSTASIDYSYVLTGLDTGKTYYCRAYALLKGSPVYSPVISVGKVAPLITSVSTNTDTLSNPTIITIGTNFKNLNSSDQVSVYLGTTQLNILSKATNTTGTVFVTSYPGQLPAGNYNFTVKFNSININYNTNIAAPQGLWTNVGQLSYSQFIAQEETFGFVKDNWVYSYRLIVGQYPQPTITEFIKQNISTSQIVQLSTFDQTAHFILASGIAFVGNTVHLIGGEENDLYTRACVNTHYVYNFDTDTWTKASDFPGSVRRSAATMVYNNKIYYGMGYKIVGAIGSGSAEEDRNDMWSYDLQTLQWQQLASFPQDGRSHCTSFSIGSKVYVVGGYDRISPEYSTWCYDAIANTWSQKANFPGAGFEDAASFQLNNYGYVGLGTEGAFDSYTGPVVSASFFRYDPTNDNWKQVPNLGYYAQYAICGVDGKYGVIAGGFSSLGVAQSIYTYTP